MSPEQCSGLDVSEASDQYALGAVALRAGDRHAAVRGLDPHRHAGARRARATRDPRALRADCPPEVEAAILRMLAKDPAERWPRLVDAMAAVGAAAAGGRRPASRRADRVRGRERRRVDLRRAADQPRPRAPARRSRAARPAGRSGASPSCRRPPASRPATASRWSPSSGASTGRGSRPGPWPGRRTRPACSGSTPTAGSPLRSAWGPR